MYSVVWYTVMQSHSCASSVYVLSCLQQLVQLQISTEEIREMEREEAWQPTKGVPVLDEDILEVTCAAIHIHASAIHAFMFDAYMLHASLSHASVWHASVLIFFLQKACLHTAAKLLSELTSVRAADLRQV